MLVVAGVVLIAAGAGGAGYAIAHSAPPNRPTGAQVRITVAGGCPRTLDRIDGRPAGSGLGSRLAPAGTPNRALVCSYRPGRTSAAQLAQATRLRPAAARLLGATVARVRIVWPPGAMPCRMGAGTATVIVLGYPDRPDVDIWYAASGCQRVPFRAHH